MRIFPVMLPQKLNDFPAIAFRELPIDPTNTFDGGSTYDYHHLDIHFYARDYDDVKTLFDVFRSEIEDTVGTYDSVDIDHIWFQSSGLEDYIEDLDLWTKHMALKIAVRR
ncbi:MAG: hypothetical protein JXL67_06180 [Calditrichaeota bacterium]|nr:hypothetical protein [Calditrichota bacterium]